MNPKKTIICPGCGWWGKKADLFSTYYGKGGCPECAYRCNNGNLRTIEELFKDNVEKYNGVRLDLFLGTLFGVYMRSEWGRKGGEE